MSNPSLFSVEIERAFQPSEHGVAGLADNVLRLDFDLLWDWHADRCRIRSREIEPAETVELPLPRSVFRAVLARIAVLCNEQAPGSASPYRGEAELRLRGFPAASCRVVFANSPGETWVRVTRKPVALERLPDVPPAEFPFPTPALNERIA